MSRLIGSTVKIGSLMGWEKVIAVLVVLVVEDAVVVLQRVFEVPGVQRNCTDELNFVVSVVVGVGAVVDEVIGLQIMVVDDLSDLAEFDPLSGSGVSVVVVVVSKVLDLQSN